MDPGGTGGGAPRPLSTLQDSWRPHPVRSIFLADNKKRRKNSPYHSSSFLHSPNKQHVRQKRRCFCDRRLMPFINSYDKKERPCLQANSYKKFVTIHSVFNPLMHH